MGKRADKLFDGFDEETKLKLQIIRLYFREWIPVFLARRPRAFQSVFVADLFSGKGQDAKGEEGSPLIILEEFRKFFASSENVWNGTKSYLLFNDYNHETYEELGENLKRKGEDCVKGCKLFAQNVKCYAENQPFQEVYKKCVSTLKSPATACFLLLDQYGLKEVTVELLREIAKFPAVDLIFFVSSSTVFRFARESSKNKGRTITNYIPVIPSEVEELDSSQVHRYVCRTFSQAINEPNYHFAPFSLKSQNGNINGVIFGTKNLLGLQKFLDVAWKLDGSAGEANFNIDGNVCYRDQRSLFDEDNTPRKLQVFEDELLEFIVKKRPNNCEVYRFCLEQGISIKRSNEVLRGLQNQNKISVVKPDGKAARKGSFYLTWECYDSREIKAYFSKIKS